MSVSSGKTVTIVGAGFAGLTLAYELLEQGLQVEIHEKESHAGGLLGTRHTSFGLVETAANALLANADIELLFAELNLKFAERRFERRKRYIYWEKPRRWPLPLRDTVRLIINALRVSFGHEALLPEAGESIASWARRFGGKAFEERVLVPGLQGIYAGDAEKMSAVLILKAMFGDKPKRHRLKGSVAPAGGMGALIRALEKHIIAKGGAIHYKSDFTLPASLPGPTVITTSAWAAAALTRAHHPRLSELLARAESLPLVSVTAFFSERAGDPRGFGCLFPRAQGFSALGVLFNSCIFEGRASRSDAARSETWILGGAHEPNILAENDTQILQRIERDRQRLNPDTAAPVHVEIVRWPRAIPHYTLDWERKLMQLNPKPPLYIHGNYLGEIGLARIYARSRRLAEQIKEQYG